MKIPRRRFLDLAAGAAGLVSVAISVLAVTGSAAWSQTSRTIKVVVPFAAGGVADTLARLLAEQIGRLEATLGGKWLELLSEIVPGLKRAIIMFNPDVSTASLFLPSLETAARSLKVVPMRPFTTT
jgi:putative ABC transport system substrate-binding protein